MIRISDAAQAHFAKLLANQEEGTQIRVFVINPGTPNAECGVSYCPPDAVEDTDTALKFEQLTAYVDELSAPYLEDAEIDFVTDQLGSQLTLKAPNAKMRKVSDDAPLMERVEYLLQSQINPQLAGHGGRVSLMEIPALAISSTDCRARVAGGQPVWYLVPDGVVQYISKHRLYAEADHAPGESPAPRAGSGA